MLLNVSAAVPVLVTVTDCAPLVVPTVWLANGKLDGDRLTTGTAVATAVPVSETAWGLEAALSVSVIAPVGVPEAVGLKVTETVQLAFAARLAPQLFVSAKLPEAAMLLNVSAAVPVLLSVTDCAALVFPTVWLANVKLAGDKPTTGTAATAVPVTAILVGVFEALLAMAIVPASEPAAAGAKLTVSVADCPGLRVSGKLIPLVWKLLLLLFACEIVTLVLPLLLNVVVVVAVWPTVSVSIAKLAGDALRVPSTDPCSGYSYAPMS